QVPGERGMAQRRGRVEARPQRVDDRVDLDGLHVARPVAQGSSRVVAGARAHDQDAVATLGKAEGRVIRAFIAVAAGDFGVSCQKFRSRVGNAHVAGVVDVDGILALAQTDYFEFLVRRPVGLELARAWQPQKNNAEGKDCESGDAEPQRGWTYDQQQEAGYAKPVFGRKPQERHARKNTD